MVMDIVLKFVALFSIQTAMFTFVYSYCEEKNKMYSFDLSKFVINNYSKIEKDKNFFTKIKIKMENIGPDIVFEKNLIFGNNNIKEIKIEGK